MKEQKKGVLFGFIAYVFWGIIPIYWKLLPTVDPLDILCYRIVWSFLFMIIYILVTRKWSLFLAEVKTVLQDKKKLFAIICLCYFDISQLVYLYLYS